MFACWYSAKGEFLLWSPVYLFLVITAVLLRGCVETQTTGVLGSWGLWETAQCLALRLAFALLGISHREGHVEEGRRVREPKSQVTRFDAHE